MVSVLTGDGVRGVLKKLPASDKINYAGNQLLMKKYLTIGRMLLVGVVLGLLFWLLDSAVDAFLFEGSSFLSQMFSPDPGELWMRLFVLLSFIGFALRDYNFACKEGRRYVAS
jgi:hypothetical protein